MESEGAKFMYPIPDAENFNIPAIIPRIQKIEFLHLEILNLEVNAIKSVEVLHRVPMPNLK